MPQYRVVGKIPRKRHTQFRDEEGNLYHEEGIGIEGFRSHWSLLYHRHLPTAITAAEKVPEEPQPLVPNHPPMPRHLRTQQLKVFGDPVTGRQLLLGNEDVRLSYLAATESSALYRNAIGYELFYIQQGQATLETIFGNLQVGTGDYVVIPTSVTHRWVLAGQEPLRALVVESVGYIGPPDRYLSKRGQFIEQSPYCERDLRLPDGPLLVDGENVDVLVRTEHGLAKFTYRHHPFDVVGWDGCLYPYALNISDFEPLTGRIHQPPPVHQTFEGPGMVVCSFVPRKLDYHPEAIPVPYTHSNVDSDEVLFYVGGDYGGRRGAGIGVGSISLHPSGVSHGPAPGAVEASLGREQTDEVAVMVDTFRPLKLGPAALASENKAYAWHWAGGSR